MALYDVFVIYGRDRMTIGNSDTFVININKNLTEIIDILTGTTWYRLPISGGDDVLVRTDDIKSITNHVEEPEP